MDRIYGSLLPALPVILSEIGGGVQSPPKRGVFFRHHSQFRWAGRSRMGWYINLVVLNHEVKVFHDLGCLSPAPRMLAHGKCPLVFGMSFVGTFYAVMWKDPKKRTRDLEEGAFKAWTSTRYLYQRNILKKTHHQNSQVLFWRCWRHANTSLYRLEHTHKDMTSIELRKGIPPYLYHTQTSQKKLFTLLKFA